MSTQTVDLSGGGADAVIAGIDEFNIIGHGTKV